MSSATALIASMVVLLVVAYAVAALIWFGGFGAGGAGASASASAGASANAKPKSSRAAQYQATTERALNTAEEGAAVNNQD